MNPYQVTSPIPDMSGTILHAAQLGQQNRQFEQTNALNQQKLYAEHPDIKPWGNGEYLKTITKAKMAGIPVDKISFFNTDLMEMARNPEMNRGDVANTIDQKWPDIYRQTSDEIRDHVIKLSDQAAKIQPTDPKYKEIAGQIEQMGNLQTAIDGIKSPKEAFFPDIAQYENSKRGQIGELEKVIGQDGKPVLVTRGQAVGRQPYLTEENTTRIIPAGGVLLDKGKVVYANPSRSSVASGAKTANGVAGPTQKEVDDTVKKLDKYTDFYTKQNKDLSGKSDDASKKMISYNSQQIQNVAYAKAQVLSGEKSPSDIWVKPGGQKQEGKPLDKNTAQSLLDEAGGDKNKARELAKLRGYSF